MDNARFGPLEVALGHAFRDQVLLVRALTHKSRRFEQAATPETPLVDNEQLEFLGDAVLGFVVSELLVERYPKSPEGRLSKLKARLVSANCLHESAQKLGLGDYLLLGRGEEMSGGRKKKALLSNAMEALIAAIYLDGGIDCVRRFILQSIVPEGDAFDEELEVIDFKSALQELTQSLKLPPPRYAIVRERGPEHSKTFTVEVRVGKDYVGQADGASKKDASQRAAQLVFDQMRP
jgi:ribonuclease III